MGTAIGFLQPGQTVNLLYEAFPCQKFGVQKGHIMHISKAAYMPGELDAPFSYKTAVYQVVVALDEQTIMTYGHKMARVTGMALKGDMVIDRRTVLAWLFDPLLAAHRRSG